MTDTAAPVTRAVAETTQTVTGAAYPVVQAVSDSVRPVTRTVSETIAAVADTARPVTGTTRAETDVAPPAERASASTSVPPPSPPTVTASSGSRPAAERDTNLSAERAVTDSGPVAAPEHREDSTPPAVAAAVASPVMSASAPIAAHAVPQLYEVRVASLIDGSMPARTGSRARTLAPAPRSGSFARTDAPGDLSLPGGTTTAPAGDTAPPATARADDAAAAGLPSFAAAVSSGAFAAAAASAGSGAAAIAIFVGLVFAALLIVVPRITPLARPILFISLNERPG